MPGSSEAGVPDDLLQHAEVKPSIGFSRLEVLRKVEEPFRPSPHRRLSMTSPPSTYKFLVHNSKVTSYYVVCDVMFSNDSD